LENCSHWSEFTVADGLGLQFVCEAIAGFEAGGIDAVEQPLPGANIEGMR
jgi:hypothetical protein